MTEISQLSVFLHTILPYPPAYPAPHSPLLIERQKTGGIWKALPPDTRPSLNYRLATSHDEPLLVDMRRACGWGAGQHYLSFSAFPDRSEPGVFAGQVPSLLTKAQHRVLHIYIFQAEHTDVGMFVNDLRISVWDPLDLNNFLYI